MRGIFFGRIFEGFFGRNSTKSYLNMEEIDLFVKILVFVKILSQWKEEGKKKGRKEGRIFILRSVIQSSLHLKTA